MALVKIRIVCEECGCTFEHRHTSRNRADADSYIAWAEENVTICPKCWGARKRAEKEAAAAAAAAEFVLPELTGTEKQVAWAITLRNEAIKLMVEIRNHCNENDQKIVTPAINTLIERHTDARWWIDNTRSAHDTDYMRFLSEIIFETENATDRGDGN